MFSWKGKFLGLRERFLAAVGAYTEPQAGPSPDPVLEGDLQPDSLAALYAVFLGFEKRHSFYSDRTRRPAQFLDEAAPVVVKAEAAILAIRADRTAKTGLWEMSVSTDGRMSISDDPERALTCGGLLMNEYILPFENMLVQQGFRRMDTAVGPFRGISFIKSELSDKGVAQAFVDLDRVLLQDDKIISLEGTRHDVKPEHRVSAHRVPEYFPPLF